MSEMTTQEHADWLVYSREHNAWWRPKAAGYCTHIDGAGRYTKEKADACASSRSVTDPEAPPEFAVPAPEAYEAIAARLKALEEATDLAIAVNKVLQKVQRYISMYLEPCDTRLVLDDETINAIIGATDNVEVCRLQRKIAILDTVREVEK